MSDRQDLPILAPVDDLTRDIQKVLALVEPYDYEPPIPRYDGYCGAAAEAYLHLSGSRHSGFKVKRLGRRDGSSHWWLENAKGRVIDLTLGPADRRRKRNTPREMKEYRDGKGKMFQNGYEQPSRRAAAIMHLVQALRDNRL